MTTKLKDNAIFCLTITLLILASSSKFVAAAPKPNIIVFLTDDQGYGDLGCYGSQDIATPNIDKLCAEGMKLTRFYVHNRCSPTRAALLTGCHGHRAGIDKVVYRPERIGLSEDEITVAELLQQAGYTTGLVGKWHLGEWDAFNPVHHGFDSFYGFMKFNQNRNTAIYQNEKIVEQIKHKTDGIHSPKLLAAGIKFIEENKDRPFFLYYASPLPHVKWLPNDRFKGSSKQGTYGDIIQEIDWQVGELLNRLDELDLADNTLVVFASDNGPQLNIEGHGSAGILRDGKWTNFEGGIRVPCIMRWPAKISAGTINNDITGIIDLLPTFCELAAIEVPTDRTIDGRSILPYMLGVKRNTPIHDTFIVPKTTIIHNDWKLLIKGQKPGGSKSDTVGKTDRVPAEAGSLFNLKNDPGETTNIAKQHPEIVKQLQQKMDLIMQDFETHNRKVGRVPE